VLAVAPTFREKISVGDIADVKLFELFYVSQ
jgi:hypothetical protein